MRYSIIYSDAAYKQLSKMDKYDKKRIFEWIEKNLVGTENPRQFGKGLSGNLTGFWRYRVGKYRVIAEIRENEVIVEIIAVGHRANIYDN